MSLVQNDSPSDNPGVKLAALQLPQVWGDKAGTLVRLGEALGNLRDVDLVLLPELAITGYVSPRGDTDLRPVAETLDGPTCEAVAALAVRYKMALAAPLVERDRTSFYNACVLIDAQGRRIGHWRKRHPWIPERWASPGDLGTPVVDWRGLRLAAAICYDLHFLADEAAAELELCDVLLFPSAWVEEGRDTRVPQLQALAKRFGTSIVNANWARSDPALPGQGGSVILDARGRALARAGGDRAAALVAEVGAGTDPPGRPSC
jgi:5-aminopentanamidase